MYAITNHLKTSEEKYTLHQIEIDYINNEAKRLGVTTSQMLQFIISTDMEQNKENV